MSWVTAETSTRHPEEILKFIIKRLAYPDDDVKDMAERYTTLALNNDLLQRLFSCIRAEIVELFQAGLLFDVESLQMFQIESLKDVPSAAGV